MTTNAADTVLPDEDQHRVSASMIWVGVATLVVGLVGGFFIGRGTASSGPSSLADALTQASNGSLPRGDVVGALQKSGGFRAVPEGEPEPAAGAGPVEPAGVAAPALVAAAAASVASPGR